MTGVQHKLDSATAFETRDTVTQGSMMQHIYQLFYANFAVPLVVVFPEIVVDSGYVSGSGDEIICLSHPTPDKPTAKFRCQLCNTFLNSPAQAKQVRRKLTNLLI